ncbi:GGDEF and EAL domain-containing protein [Lichenibacterium minor]|uniref:GGDEF and EAL domain-containing protein n=1 Tax=Lichenibacterium minor TaxID=2316528 RepID=A0A4Q2U046_9HYPH|nr:EAL domain-containing protein [Lichenibacterium minor]RYC29779.1 GGDEF and EAL domain-containing protein [Lichenibacterium minor]
MPLRHFPFPADEPQRLETLRSYRLDGPAPEAEFDHVVRLAADIFEVPTALVSFVEEDQQFFKARVGFDTCETSRDISFCAHALMSDDVLVIPDARAEERFASNPLVTGHPFIRFYAGAPIITPSGQRLGSVCVIDTEPRAPLTDREQRILRGLAKVVVDHLERRRLDVVRRAATKMASTTPDAIVCSDEKGTISFWNAAAERMFGFGHLEAVGMPLTSIIPSEFRAGHEAGMARVLAGGERRLAGKTVEIRGQRRSGEQFPIELSLATWKDGDHLQVGSIIRDVSERHHARERMRYLTHFDRLTDLPNRAQFLERVDKALTMSGRFTLLKMGLDRFKAINGTMGMAVGDLVLTEVGRRVREATGPDAFVARLGADEFGVLISGSDDPITADATGQKLLQRMGEPFNVGGSMCHLSASIGIVLCPGLSHFDVADAALKAALLALQHAKMAGGRRCELFQPQFGQQANDRHQIEEELRQAFARDEFELHFQPQVTLPDARLVGAEALLRWRHPLRGLLSPAVFLPILETSEMAVDVGRWILRRGCSFAAEAAAGGTPIRVGVNLFAAQLRDPAFFDDILAALASTGLPNHLLELEITETTVLGLDESVIAPLRRLRDLGVKVAFDDYGTGYASLSLLKRYPLTRLKIDREFVRDLNTDADDAAIVKAVLAMGASLGLEVIAEGIETAEQATTLAALCCREAQGYRFGKPVPAAAFRHLLAPASGSVAA